MDNFIVTCDSDYDVNHDYAYVMLSSKDSDLVDVVFSEFKLDPKDVIQLMYENKADIGCDLYFTNKKHNDWMEIEFYSGLLWQSRFFKSKDEN